MTTKETWRTIPSLPHYEASSWGRVRRKPHLKPLPGNRGMRRYGGKPYYGVLRPGTGGPRYFMMDGKKNYRVARLVCEAFHGPPPPGKPNCLHRDEDALNNKPGNLKWGTQRENLNAPGFLEYCKGRTGENNPAVKGRKRRKTHPVKKGWRRKP